MLWYRSFRSSVILDPHDKKQPTTDRLRVWRLAAAGQMAERPWTQCRR
jgi:hypothetical protein